MPEAAEMYNWDCPVCAHTNSDYFGITHCPECGWVFQVWEENTVISKGWAIPVLSRKIYDPKDYLEFFLVSKANQRSKLLYNGGPLPKSLEEALAISIAKWESVTAFYEEFSGVLLDGGAETCGLCMAFFEVGCQGCPINSMGYYKCKYTPYDLYGNDKKYKTAKAELDFLLSITLDGAK